MKLQFRVLLAACPLLLTLFVSAPLPLSAQENGVLPSPKFLQIDREFVKPGKSGTAHEATEGAFIRALAASKTASSHYTAVVSLSGPSRALFMYSYPSLAAIEAEHKAIDSDPVLSAALDRASLADGELLSEFESSTWAQRPDLSLNPGFRVGSHYEEISQFVVRPGHRKEWEDLVKLVIAGYKKGVPEAHWAMYEEIYGSPGGRYLVITSVKSATDLDNEFASGKKFEDAMGEEGMKKMAALEASCVESAMTNLFWIDPKMSNPSEEMTKADPDFWKGQP
jgi:hypothetical protein